MGSQHTVSLRNKNNYQSQTVIGTQTSGAHIMVGKCGYQKLDCCARISLMIMLLHLGCMDLEVWNCGNVLAG